MAGRGGWPSVSRRGRRPRVAALILSHGGAVRLARVLTAVAPTRWPVTAMRHRRVRGRARQPGPPPRRHPPHLPWALLRSEHSGESTYWPRTGQRSSTGSGTGDLRLRRRTRLDAPRSPHRPRVSWRRVSPYTAGNTPVQHRRDDLQQLVSDEHRADRLAGACVGAGATIIAGSLLPRTPDWLRAALARYRRRDSPLPTRVGNRAGVAVRRPRQMHCADSRTPSVGALPRTSRTLSERPEDLCGTQSRLWVAPVCSTCRRFARRDGRSPWHAAVRSSWHSCRSLGTLFFVPDVGLRRRAPQTTVLGVAAGRCACTSSS
jgi:hypothetical protein